MKRINYGNLNARQKENYNFLKVSAVLADYGYMTMRLSDDWQDADFIAQHIDGKTFLKVQLKSRLAVSKRYCSKDLYIAFFHKPNWYLFPHDEVLKKILAKTGIKSTSSWQDRGGYSWPRLSGDLIALLEQYKIGRPIADGVE